MEMEHIQKKGSYIIPTRALLLFAGLTFVITWGIAGSYIFFDETMTALFGDMRGIHPFYFIATWGPGIAGIVVVVKYGGVGGLKAFLGRLLM